jgi:hypothetical protein
VRLYHFTLRLTAERIMREGFRDSDPEAVRGDREGVWLADLDLAAAGELPADEFATIAVDVPDAELDRFEIHGNPMVAAGSHREWCIPASHVNRWPISIIR